MAVARRGSSAFVFAANYYTNEVRSFRIDRSGNLHPVGQVAVGAGPTGVTLAQGGRFALTANSVSDDISVLRVRRGNLTEVARVPAGGSGTHGLAVHRNFVVAANSSSDNLTVFRLDRRGNLHPTASEPVGINPVSVAVSRRGVVVVTNYGSGDLSVLQLQRRSGTLILLNSSVPAGFSPASATFAPRGRSLFVATRSTQPGATEDEVVGFRVDRSGNLHPSSATPAGFFLTDISLSGGGDHLVAGTSNGASDQVIEFRRRGENLFPVCSGLFGTGTPSPKHTATVRIGGDRFHLVTEFSNNSIKTFTH